MLKDLPVQVEKPSVSGLVVEVHPHRQHDVVAPVVLRLDTKIYDFFIICTDCILATLITHYNLHDHGHHPHDQKHNHDNLPDF